MAKLKVDRSWKKPILSVSDAYSIRVDLATNGYEFDRDSRAWTKEVEFVDLNREMVFLEKLDVSVRGV